MLTIMYYHTFDSGVNLEFTVDCYYTVVKSISRLNSAPDDVSFSLLSLTHSLILSLSLSHSRALLLPSSLEINIHYDRDEASLWPRE